MEHADVPIFITGLICVGLGKLNTDFLQYYNLENYLFTVVSRRYAEKKTLSVFDFFCIVIWKANRAKSKVAQRLINHGDGQESLETAVHSLLTAISDATDKRTRLYVLIKDWRFRLPMASAILTVLYPDDFTVYDVRVCDVLVDDFRDAQFKTNFDVLWERYSAYILAVKEAVPERMSLRDKDRILWGQSFATQLNNDIQSAFERRVDSDVEFYA